MQDKLQTGGGVMNEPARGQLEKDIEKAAARLELFQQDAQAEIDRLQQQAPGRVPEKLIPIVEAIRAEKGLH